MTLISNGSNSCLVDGSCFVLQQVSKSEISKSQQCQQISNFNIWFMFLGSRIKWLKGSDVQFDTFVRDTRPSNFQVDMMYADSRHVKNNDGSNNQHYSYSRTVQ